VGWVSLGRARFGRVQFRHSKSIKEDERRFAQGEHPQEMIEETPVGGLQVEDPVRSPYGGDLSENVLG